MGLYSKVKDNISEKFSIFQLMSLLEMDESDIRECRNILKQWYLLGYIKRISKNMYQKIKKS